MVDRDAKTQEAKPMNANSTEGGPGTQWRSMLLAALIGAIGGGSVPFWAPDSHTVRVDRFTGSDAAQMEERFALKLEQMESQYELRLGQVKHQLCVRQPPEETKARISTNESWISQRDPLFTPGSRRWNDGKCD